MMVCFCFFICRRDTWWYGWTEGNGVERISCYGGGSKFLLLVGMCGVTFFLSFFDMP